MSFKILNFKQVASFKTVIMEQIAAAKIKVYEFPEVEDGEEAERKENRRMKVALLENLFAELIWLSLICKALA